LDWSAPELFRRIGLDPDHLLASHIATWKKHVTLKMRDGCSVHYVPSEWLAGSPFHVNLATLHVERNQMDDEIFKMVQDAGVSLIHERAVNVETNGERVSAIQMESGARITSPWFIDATGVGTSLLARKFELPSIQYGPTKVAMWSYFKISQPVEGTTLYMDPSPTEYLEWIWEIPVRPDTVSVGYIAPGSVIKNKRDAEGPVENVFRQQLMKFPRFQELLQQQNVETVNVTSFRCRVYPQSTGPNWLLAGEAASLVDPMTSNGVTAALRHASEAAAMITKSMGKKELPWLARKLYSSRILQTARFFNEGIEKIVYEPPVRNRIGLGPAGTAYTSPAWSMNVVYARLSPPSLFSTFILNTLLKFFQVSASLYYRYCSRLKSSVAKQECSLG
ncbi:MAG TPA: tryptophan 7-halogenase, partial [Terriglobales bacterium]|nr:tryptophan 7-halogenase [Terriglobales bacterium]